MPDYEKSIEDNNGITKDDFGKVGNRTFEAAKRVYDNDSVDEKAGNDDDKDKAIVISDEKQEIVPGFFEVPNEIIDVAFSSTFLSEDRRKNIRENLDELDDIKSGVIEKLDDEDLSLAVKRTSGRLMRYHGIDARLMTPKEAESMEKWAENAENGSDMERCIIEGQKVNLVLDMIEKSLNGRKARRDTGKRVVLVELLEKGSDWKKKGTVEKIRISDIGYDLSGIKGLMDEDDSHRLGQVGWNGFEDEDRRVKIALVGDSIDTLKDVMEGKTSSKSYEVEDAVESLLEHEVVDEDEDRLVFGPYSVQDIAEIRKHCGATFTTADARYMVGPVDDFIESSRLEDIENGLNRRFVQEKILPKRRLAVENMTSVAAAFAIEANKALDETYRVLGTTWHDLISKSDEDRSEPERICFHMGVKIGQISKYCADVCDFSREELKERYGKVQPRDEEFYREIIERVDGWTEQQAKEKNKAFNGTAYKIFGHLEEMAESYQQLLDIVAADEMRKKNNRVLPGFESSNEVE